MIYIIIAHCIFSLNFTYVNEYALKGYSPVSYLELGKAELGKDSISYDYQGKTYLFTTIEQLNKFKNNPMRYLPQFSGYCAFGMCDGLLLEPDPNKFLVRNNKYYLFINSLDMDGKALWLERNHNTMVERAKFQWDKMQLFKSLDK